VGYKLPPLGQLDKVVSMIDRFPLPSKLFSIVSVLPTLAASCEGVFSNKNNLKNTYRSSLQESSINDLVMINVKGPGLGDFDATRFVEH
jgi:hypothetical protein